MLLVFVDAKDDGFDDLTDGEDVGWTGDALGPGELGDVDEAFDAFFHFDECTVGDQFGDLAADLLSDGVTGFDVLPWVALHLLETEGDALLLTVNFKDLHFKLLTDGHHL